MGATSRQARACAVSPARGVPATKQGSGSVGAAPHAAKTLPSPCARCLRVSPRCTTRAMFCQPHTAADLATVRLDVGKAEARSDAPRGCECPEQPDRGGGGKAAPPGARLLPRSVQPQCLSLTQDHALAPGVARTHAGEERLARYYHCLVGLSSDYQSIIIAAGRGEQPALPAAVPKKRAQRACSGRARLRRTGRQAPGAPPGPRQATTPREGAPTQAQRSGCAGSAKPPGSGASAASALLPPPRSVGKPPRSVRP